MRHCPCSGRQPGPPAQRLTARFVNICRSIRLSAEECRNVELVVLRGIMHRTCRPSGSRPCGAPFLAYSETGSCGACTAGRPARRRRTAAAVPAAALRPAAAALSSFRPRPTAARRCMQGHAALLRMIGVGDDAALGAQLVLRRHRQFLDARHARGAHGSALRLRRDEGALCRRTRDARPRGSVRGRATASAGSAGSITSSTAVCGITAAATAALAADSIVSVKACVIA